jgi:hypothetical protein
MTHGNRTANFTNLHNREIAYPLVCRHGSVLEEKSVSSQLVPEILQSHAIGAFDLDDGYGG